MKLGVRKLRLFAILYVFIICITGHMHILGNFYLGMLSVPLLFIIPFVLGQVFIEHIGLRMFDEFILEAYVAWVLGSLFLSIFYILLQAALLLTLIKFSGYIILVIFLLILFRDARYILRNKRSSEIRTKVTFVELIIVGSYTAFNFYISRRYIPFPMVGYDYVNLHSVYLILSRAKEYGFFLHGRMGWLSFILPSVMIADIDPLAIMWFGPIFEMFFFYLGMLLIAKSFISDRVLQYITVVISGYILSNNGIFFSNYFTEHPEYSLYPSITLIMMFPFVVYMVFGHIRQEQYIEKLTLRKFLLVFLGLLVWEAINLVVANIKLIIKNIYGIDPYEYHILMPSLVVQALISIIAILFLVYSSKKSDRTTRMLAVMMQLLMLIALYHETEAFLYFFGIDMLLLVIWTERYSWRIRYSLKILLGLATGLLVAIQYYGIVNLDGIALSAILYPPARLVRNTFDKKLASIIFAFPSISLYIFLVSLMLVTFSKDNDSYLIAMPALVYSFIYFSPEPFSFRFCGQMIVFYSLSLASLLNYIERFVSIITSILNGKVHTGSRLIKTFTSRIGIIVAVLIALTVISPLFRVYADRYSELPNGNLYHSKLAEYEWELAEWFKRSTDMESLVLSDLFTMFVINSLANRLFVVKPVMLVWELPPYEYEKVLLIHKIFRSNTSEEAYNLILQFLQYRIFSLDEVFIRTTNVRLNAVKFYIVLTSRTLAWIDSKTLQTPFVPRFKDISEKYYSVFMNNSYFELVKSSRYYYVFRVKGTFDHKFY